MLPLGASLLVADRLDAAEHAALVPWPDDSSLHLVGSLPDRRVARWLDVGTGSAVAPLARPGAAVEIVGADLNPRAVAAAALGAALSGVRHLTAVRADLTDGVDGPFELVTFNAPMPPAGGPHHVPGPAAAGDGAPLWRRGPAGLLDRFWPAARAAAPSGLVIVHAACAALPPRGALPGERVTVAYTPPGAPAFAMTWWAPAGPTRDVRARRALTPGAPHLTWQDRDAALRDGDDLALRDAW